MLTKKEEFEKDMIEYQKSQDSAEHFNTMIWILIPIFISIMGSILSYSYINTYPDIKNGELITIILGIGLFTLTYFIVIIDGANNKKILKYNICKSIEQKYNFIGQNKLVEKLPNIIPGMNIFRIGIYLILLFYFVLLIKKLFYPSNVIEHFVLQLFIIGVIVLVIINLLLQYRDNKKIYQKNI